MPAKIEGMARSHNGKGLGKIVDKEPIHHGEENPEISVKTQSMPLTMNFKSSDIRS